MLLAAYYRMGPEPRVSFALIAFIIVAVAAIIVILTALRHRRHAAATDQRMCPGCATPNPLHAGFCRNCGRKLLG